MADEVMERIKRHEKKKAILAHEITKKLAEETKTYSTAFEVLELVARDLNWMMKQQKPVPREYPVDKNGVKVELPEAEAPGSED